jgi:death-on-curing protein
MDYEEIEGIRYLSEENLVYINEVALAYTPKERVGVMFKSDLEYSQQKVSIYRNLANCDDIFILTSVLYLELSHKHIFYNGNNRTAFMAACVFLEINGYCFEPCFDSTMEVSTCVKEKHEEYCEPEYLSSWFFNYSHEIDFQKENKALSFASKIVDLATSS